MRLFVFLLAMIASANGSATTYQYPAKWSDCLSSFVPTERLVQETYRRFEDFRKGFTVDNMVVRAITDDDVPTIKTLMLDERFQQTTGIFFDAPGLERQLRRSTRPSFSTISDSHLDLGIVSKIDNRVIGTFTIYTPLDEKDVELNSAMIAYGLAQEYWSKGIMRELLPHFIKHFFKTLQLRRLVAHTLETNLASMRLLQNNGFVRGGTSDPFQPELFPGLKYIHWSLENPDVKQP